MLTIIVPVYNVENCLKQCLDSIINQKYQNFECIVVDDGSTDRSGEICDEYARLDSRIVVIHKENGGVSSARNIALERANGDFITFVDADDYLEKDAYSDAIEKLDSEDCQIYVFGYKVIEEDKEYITFDSNVIKIYSYNEYIYELFRHPSALRRTVWNKVFDRRLIENVRFDEVIKYGEDSKFLLEVLNENILMYYDSKPKYNYYVRCNSASHDGLDYVDVLSSIGLQVELLERFSFNDDLYDFILASMYDLWLFKLNQCKYTKRELRQCFKKYKSIVVKYIPKIIFNRYLSLKEKIIYTVLIIKV